MLLLNMLEEKPGLEVDAIEGNPFGEEIGNKVPTWGPVSRGEKIWCLPTPNPFRDEAEDMVPRRVPTPGTRLKEYRTTEIRYLH